MGVDHEGAMIDSIQSPAGGRDASRRPKGRPGRSGDKQGDRGPIAYGELSFGMLDRTTRRCVAREEQQKSATRCL